MTIFKAIFGVFLAWLTCGKIRDLFIVFQQMFSQRKRENRPIFYVVQAVNFMVLTFELKEEFACKCLNLF